MHFKQTTKTQEIPGGGLGLPWRRSVLLVRRAQKGR